MLNLLSHLAMHVVPRQFSGRMAAIALLTTVLGACSISELPGLYRIDIQQGNVVNQDMLAQLEPGMDKRRVRFVLGTPLLADTFNDDRWDYIYTYKTGSGTRVQRNITVFFEDERLARLEGDVERAVLRPKAPEPTDTIVKIKGPRERRGFLANLNPFSGTPEGAEDVTATAPEKRPTQANREETATEVKPTGESGQREPEPLTPVITVDRRADKATIDPQAMERAPSEQAALGVPAGRTPGATDAAPAASTDEPSWWQRVKQRVGVIDDDAQTAQDRPASEQAPTNPQTRASTTVTAAFATPAVASDEGAAKPEAKDGDRGFFERIRDRFKIPELPPFPTPEAPTDSNPDSGDP
jgi:outer membrane protein assembly factor BamE